MTFSATIAGKKAEAVEQLRQTLDHQRQGSEQQGAAIDGTLSLVEKMAGPYGDDASLSGSVYGHSDPSSSSISLSLSISTQPQPSTDPNDRQG